MTLTHELTAALQCAASSAALANSPRTDLQGILFDFLPDGILRLVGSNGQRMTMVTLTVGHSAPGQRVFMPLTAYPDALAALPSTGQVQFAVWGEQLIIMSGGGAHVVNGTEPPVIDYAGVFEARRPPSPTAVFNLQYLRDLYASCHELTDRYVYIELYDGGAAYFRPRLRDGFAHITDVRVAIMPCGRGSE